MKRILCLFLGLAMGAGSAYSQQPFQTDNSLFQRKLQLQPPTTLRLEGFAPQPNSVLAVITTSPERIQLLSPDRMACLVPDLARVERMPVQRLSNSDPMPNGLPHDKVIFGHPRPTLVRPDRK